LCGSQSDFEIHLSDDGIERVVVASGKYFFAGDRNFFVLDD